MRRIKSSGAPILFSVLMAATACVPVAGQLPETVTPEADACGATGLQGLVGQSGDALAGMRLPDGTRIIPPDMAVTMDYRPDRLNIDLDGRNRITRVYCT